MTAVILAGLAKLLGSTGFGTVFGGVMGYVNRKADLQIKKLELEHELKMRAADAEIMKQEWAARTKVAEVEGEAKVEAEAFSALARSYDFARPASGSKMESFSSFVRPFISLCYFLVSSFGAGFIVYYAFMVVQVKLTVEQWHGLVMFVIDWIAFMASATIGWWFAMRAGKTPTRK